MWGRDRWCASLISHVSHECVMWVTNESFVYVSYSLVSRWCESEIDEMSHGGVMWVTNASCESRMSHVYMSYIVSYRDDVSHEWVIWVTNGSRIEMIWVREYESRTSHVSHEWFMWVTNETFQLRMGLVWRWCESCHGDLSHMNVTPINIMMLMCVTFMWVTWMWRTSILWWCEMTDIIREFESENVSHEWVTWVTNESCEAHECDAHQHHEDVRWLTASVNVSHRMSHEWVMWVTNESWCQSSHIIMMLMCVTFMWVTWIWRTSTWWWWCAMTDIIRECDSHEYHDDVDVRWLTLWCRCDMTDIIHECDSYPHHDDVRCESRVSHLSQSCESRVSHLSQSCESQMSHLSQSCGSRMSHLSQSCESRMIHLSQPYPHHDDVRWCESRTGHTSHMNVTHINITMSWDASHHSWMWLTSTSWWYVVMRVTNVSYFYFFFFWTRFYETRPIYTSKIHRWDITHPYEIFHVCFIRDSFVTRIRGSHSWLIRSIFLFFFTGEP